MHFEEISMLGDRISRRMFGGIVAVVLFVLGMAIVDRLEKAEAPQTASTPAP
jgi:hypothetical protein